MLGTEKLTVPQLVKKFPACYETRRINSLTSLQLATYPYPETGKFSVRMSFHPIYLKSVLILFFPLYLGLQEVLYLQNHLPPVTKVSFSLPCAISASYLILLYKMIEIAFGEGRSCDAPLYAAFSIPLLFPPSLARRFFSVR